MKTKRMLFTTVFLAAALVIAAVGAPAMDHGSGGGMPDDMTMTGGTQGVAAGEMIAETRIEGYKLMYHLLNLKERALLMKGMEGMEMPGMSRDPDVTNHLMVFIAGPNGKLVPGTVGFQVTGPDGKVQSTMTMGMQGGYGADVILKLKGKYGIKTKAVTGDRTLLDQIAYEVK